MKKIVWGLLLALIITGSALAQSPVAKFIFEDAEAAFAKQDYKTTLAKLDEAEKEFGKINPPILYLRIMARNELLKANPKDFDMVEHLRKETAQYLKDYGEMESVRDQAREVYRVFAEVKPLVIGFVDLQKALNQCDAGKEAKVIFNKRVDELQKQLDEKKKELSQLNEELKGVSAAKEREEKEKIYKQKLQAVQQFAKDAQDDLQKYDRKLINAVIKGLRDVITKIGDQKKYTFILEAPSRESLEKLRSKTENEFIKEGHVLFYVRDVSISKVKSLDYQTAEDLTLDTINIFNKSDTSKEIIETMTH